MIFKIPSKPNHSVVLLRKVYGDRETLHPPWGKQLVSKMIKRAGLLQRDEMLGTAAPLGQLTHSSGSLGKQQGCQWDCKDKSSPGLDALPGSSWTPCSCWLPGWSLKPIAKVFVCVRVHSWGRVFRRNDELGDLVTDKTQQIVSFADGNVKTCG